MIYLEPVPSWIQQVSTEIDVGRSDWGVRDMVE